jgi:hypothetical protein
MRLTSLRPWYCNIVWTVQSVHFGWQWRGYGEQTPKERYRSTVDYCPLGEVNSYRFMRPCGEPPDLQVTGVGYVVGRVILGALILK